MLKFPRFFFLLLLAIVFISPNHVSADTITGGLITASTEWSLDQSPIIVTSDVLLGNGGSLTIAPGVVVKFMPGTQIATGAGELHAVGTADAPIVFTSLVDSPELSDYWRGVQLGHANDQMAYAQFSFGNKCLDLEQSVNISNLKMDHCGRGIHVGTSFGATISENEISNNDYGIYVLDSLSFTIDHNKILGNTFGIYFDSSNSPAITNNDIFNNTYGIGTVFTDASFPGNNIYSNTGFGFKNLGSHVVSAINNWWGDASGPLHSTNPAGVGNEVTNSVNFSPWFLSLFDNFPSVPPPPTPAPAPSPSPTPAPDPTPPPSPTPPPPPPSSEPPGLRPVVIIPGVMGSELYEGNDLIWPNTNRLLLSPSDDFLSDSLNLDDQGNSIKNISLGNIIKRIDLQVGPINKTLTNTFDELINTLTINGYILDQNLFVLPYDWRLDLDISRDELAQKIQNIQSQTGFPKVDIIAHSMGGLLAENYINRYGTSNIDKLIFAGTPHLGAPKAANSLIFGDIGIPFNIVNKNRIKEIALNSPAIYELLPNQKYFDVYQGYIRAPGDILNYQDTKSYLSSIGMNSSLIHSAQNFFDRNLEDLNYEDISVYNIVGCKIASTQNLYTVTNKIIGTQYSSGDGTVPYVSAAYSAGTQYYIKGAKHSELPSADGVRQLIANILSGDSESFQSNVSHSTNFCGLNGKELNFRSPVTIQIYDALGNHSGPDSDGIIENDIPGANYEMIDGEAYIFLPTDEGQTYTIQGTGTANSSFDLIVSDISNDQVINNILFDNVRIMPGSSITFNISQNSNDNSIIVDNSNVSSSSQFSDQGLVLIQAVNTPAYVPTSSGGGGGGFAYSQPEQKSGKILEKKIDKLPDGILVLDTKDNKTVYIIGNSGKKYGFTSEVAFTGLGFRFDLVQLGDLTDYELGGFIAYPDEIHPNGSLVWDGQTVWFINYEKRYGFRTIEEFRFCGFNLTQVVKANSADAFLSEINLLNN